MKPARMRAAFCGRKNAAGMPAGYTGWGRHSLSVTITASSSGR